MKVYFGSLSTRNKGFANISFAEDWRSLDIIPILLCKRISSIIAFNLNQKIKLRTKNKRIWIVNLLYWWVSLSRFRFNYTHAFFFPPFFPFEILLFLLHYTQTNKTEAQLSGEEKKTHADWQNMHTDREITQQPLSKEMRH